MPCGDNDDCNEANHSQNAQAKNHEHKDEACTPLCVCSCCATHFVVKDFETSSNQIAVINTVFTLHKVVKTSAAVIPIWQPPKLS